MSIKKLLYDYPRYVQAIYNLRQQILVATGERIYPNGISNYDLETPPNYSNELHSTTEIYAIKNIVSQAREIDILQRQLRENERIVRTMNIALDKLRDIDKKVIELRYFKKPKMSWIELANQLYISDRHAKRIENRAIQDLEIELKYIKIIR